MTTPPKPPENLVCANCARTPLEHPLNAPDAPVSFFCPHKESLVIAAEGAWEVRRMTQEQFRRLVRVAETLVVLGALGQVAAAFTAETQAETPLDSSGAE